MHKLNNISKLLLALTILFGIIWLGGYVARQLVIYQFFEPDNLQLVDEFRSNSSTSTLRIVQPLLVMNIISYGAFLLLLISFIITSKLNFKKYGWLFICFAIIFITSPFEIYLLSIDYKIVGLILNDNFDHLIIFELLKKRIEILSSFSLIEIFAFFGIIYLSVFQPLKKVNNEN